MAKKAQEYGGKCNKCKPDPCKCHPCYPVTTGDCDPCKELVATPIDSCNQPEYCDDGCEETISTDCILVPLPSGTITLTEVLEQLLACCNGTSNFFNILTSNSTCNEDGTITISGTYATNIGDADTINILSGQTLVGITSFTSNTYTFNIQGDSSTQDIEFTISNSTDESSLEDITVSICEPLTPVGVVDTYDSICDPDTGIITVFGTYTTNTGLIPSVNVLSGQPVLAENNDPMSFAFEVQGSGNTQLIEFNLEVASGVNTDIIQTVLPSCEIIPCIENAGVTYNCQTGVTNFQGTGIANVTYQGNIVSNGFILTLPVGINQFTFNPVSPACGTVVIDYDNVCDEFQIRSIKIFCDTNVNAVSVYGIYTNTTGTPGTIVVTSGQTIIQQTVTNIAYDFVIAGQPFTQMVTYYIQHPNGDSQPTTITVYPCGTQPCIENATAGYGCTNGNLNLSGSGYSHVTIDGIIYDDGDILNFPNGLYDVTFVSLYQGCPNVMVQLAVSCIEPPALDIITNNCTITCNSGVTTVFCNFNNTTTNIPVLVNEVTPPLIFNENVTQNTFSFDVSNFTNTPIFVYLHLEDGTTISDTEIIEIPPCV